MTNWAGILSRIRRAARIRVGSINFTSLPRHPGGCPGRSEEFFETSRNTRANEPVLLLGRYLRGGEYGKEVELLPAASRRLRFRRSGGDLRGEGFSACAQDGRHICRLRPLPLLEGCVSSGVTDFRGQGAKGQR